jgi:hypothetical protein
MPADEYLRKTLLPILYPVFLVFDISYILGIATC